MKYKVGQKVRIREDLKAGVVRKRGIRKMGIRIDDEMILYRGKEVTITAIDADGDYKIREDCGDWFWSDEMLEPIRNEKIVITSDGVTTTARKYDGKKLIKEAKAVCSKDDVFNFEVGANLAMERLLEKKPKFYNGKVVCIETPDFSIGFTKGKIYRFAEGFMLDDDNEVRPATLIPVESFEDLERKHPGIWLEVVE